MLLRQRSGFSDMRGIPHARATNGVDFLGGVQVRVCGPCCGIVVATVAILFRSLLLDFIVKKTAHV